MFDAGAAADGFESEPWTFQRIRQLNCREFRANCHKARCVQLKSHGLCGSTLHNKQFKPP
jgi:hypothetical protein